MPPAKLLAKPLAEKASPQPCLASANLFCRISVELQFFLSRFTIIRGATGPPPEYTRWINAAAA